MLATFAWLDYSEHDRRKMLDVIELFRERNTRDELGLGVVRDVFADYLFPGTSTVQTRVKYFLFIPWIYQLLEAKKTPSASFRKRVRDTEVALIKTLCQSGDTDGVIGSTSKEKLQRMPSNTYWQGLAQWGVRRFPGSQDDFAQAADERYRRMRHSEQDRGEFAGESAHQDLPPNWDSGLPKMPEGFPQTATMTLSKDEAAYLREMLLRHQPQSLLAFLVRDHSWDEIADCSFCWDLPINFPTQLGEWVEHGRCFSVALHGAALLYNLLLARAANNDVISEDFTGRMQEWWSTIGMERDRLNAWSLPRFWSLVKSRNLKIPPRAEEFIDRWVLMLSKARDLNDIIESTASQQLVRHREEGLKRGLSRFTNPRQREIWVKAYEQSGGGAGDGQMDLRWNAARRTLKDILVAVNS